LAGQAAGIPAAAEFPSVISPKTRHFFEKTAIFSIFSRSSAGTAAAITSLQNR